MSAAKHDKQEEARLLRQQGKSLREIVDTLGVSKGSVSVWVRDIELTPEQRMKVDQNNPAINPAKRGQGGRDSNRRNALARRQQYQDEGRTKAKEMDPLHMQGCLLYWCEGNKSRNTVRFSNSDPDMMKLFISFIRKYFIVEDSKLTLYVGCTEFNERSWEEIALFWSKLLHIPITQIKELQADTRERGKIAPRKNRLPYGVVGLSFSRTDIIQHIYGAIQEYADMDPGEYKWVE